MLFLRFSNLKLSRLKQQLARTIALFAIGLTPLLLVSPAFAHPTAGDKIPANGFEAFLSGIFHPLTGFDHLAFVVALGLVASTVGRRGIAIPVVFFLTVFAGASLHLTGGNLPALELVISASVLGLGLMLVRKGAPNLTLVVSCAAIFGMFHGYAYGEFVVGAPASVSIVYYTGLTVAQAVLGWVAYAMGTLLRSNTDGEASHLWLRFSGFAICGIGMTLLSSVVLV